MHALQLERMATHNTMLSGLGRELSEIINPNSIENVL